MVVALSWAKVSLDKEVSLEIQDFVECMEGCGMPFYFPKASKYLKLAFQVRENTSKG